MSIIAILLALLWIIGIGFAIFWGIEVARRHEFAWPTFLSAAVGFVTNFFDTLGIGSFAPTTSLFKFFRMAPDEKIPGTLNVGHALPTITEALIYITVIGVDPITLVLLIAASVVGAWLGAGMVARWPRRNVQIGMGGALTVAAVIFLMQNLKILPAGGNALGLSGWLPVTGVVINFCLGALMTIGIGLYAPAIIMISLLGMNPRAAFPIMMGSCAFLMPIASVRFVKFDAYAFKAAIGLTVGGIPGVIIAAYIVKSMPLEAVKWLVIAIVAYAAFTMLRSAYLERRGTPGTNRLLFRRMKRATKRLSRDADRRRGCRFVGGLVGSKPRRQFARIRNRPPLFVGATLLDTDEAWRCGARAAAARIERGVFGGALRPSSSVTRRSAGSKRLRPWNGHAARTILTIERPVTLMQRAAVNRSRRVAGIATCPAGVGAREQRLIDADRRRYRMTRRSRPCRAARRGTPPRRLAATAASRLRSMFATQARSVRA